MLAVTVLTPRHVSFCMKLYEASFRVLRKFFAGRSPVNKWHYRQRPTTLRKGAGVCPFVKSGRLINPCGFDPQGRKGSSGPRPGGEETFARLRTRWWKKGRRRWEAKKRR